MWTPPEGFRCRVVKSFDGTELNVCSNAWARHSESNVAVLLHGSPGQVSNWRYQVDYLVRKGYELVAFDLRGYGRSGKPLDISLDDYLRDLEVVLKSLGVRDEHVVLAGHSFGTVVALLYAANHPIRSLCLVSSVIKLRKGFIDWVIQHLPPIVWRRALFTENLLTRRMYRKLYFSEGVSEDVYEEFIKDNEKYLESLPPHAFRYLYRFLNYDASEYAVKVRSEAKIIVGEEDVITPPEDSLRLHKLIQGSELVVVKGAGHMILYERPEVVSNELEELLRRNS